MNDRIEKIHDSFWNLRGSFRVAKVIDVGTQMSLVRLKTGDFVLLDCYEPDQEVMREIMTRTGDGEKISSIINLHPFHTVHVPALARLFPHARLYGTRRHQRLLPDLAWQECCVESAPFQALFPTDFQFSVPRGVEFIPEDENLHFSSVLAFHEASGCLHVDDTLTFTNLPLIGGLRFHPALAKVLLRRSGAVAEFRSWVSELLEICARTNQVCTAHLRSLPENREKGSALEQRVGEALLKIEPLLQKHEAKYG